MPDPSLQHNETPIPAFSGGQRGDELRDKEIMYSYSPPPTQKGRTLFSGQGILPAGCLLGRRTADKKWGVYDDTADDGREVCRGVLRDARDTSEGDILGNVVLRGQLYNSSLSGVDANAITDLNARVDETVDLFAF